MAKRKLVKYKVNNRIKDYGQEIDHPNGSHTILVNKKKHKGKKGELIDTLTHETLHAQHPKWSEKKTYKQTARKLKKMTSKQRRKLYAKLNVQHHRKSKG